MKVLNDNPYKPSLVEKLVSCKVRRTIGTNIAIGQCMERCTGWILFGQPVSVGAGALISASAVLWISTMCRLVSWRWKIMIEKF